MLKGRKVVVVMPAYNAEATLEKTVREIDRTVVDEIILVDDRSSDATARKARELGLTVHEHGSNLGYGGNQKTCYRLALERGGDIVVMVHPDYQYDPRLVAPMASLLADGVFDVVIGSRILGGRKGCKDMPLWRWAANRALTFFQNLLLQEKFSEYHTGYRAFTREVISALPIAENSDDFIFDNEMFCQAVIAGFRIGEISCPARYLRGSSSISFLRSVKYGFGVVRVTLQALLHRSGIRKSLLFAARKHGIR